MLKTNKIISILVVAAFLLNIFAPSASACWWKGLMAGYGSPGLNGAPSQQEGNNTGKRSQETGG